MLTESGDIAFHGRSLRSVEKTAYEVLIAKVFRASSISSQNSQITEGRFVIRDPHPCESAAGRILGCLGALLRNGFRPRGRAFASRRSRRHANIGQRRPLRKRKQEEFPNHRFQLKDFDFIRVDSRAFAANCFYRRSRPITSSSQGG